MERSVEDQLVASEFVGFWKRVLISIVDVLVLLLPAYLINKFFVWATEYYHSAIPLFIQFALLGAFNIYMVVKYGGTPGKLLLKVRIINADGQLPSVKQALIRYSIYILNSLLAVIMSLSAYDNLSFFSNGGEWLPLVIGMNAFLGFVIIIDCLCVAFLKNNRAVHDLMAGTYVVDKEAMDSLK
ncbi:RDD family protein [Paenibacillus sp. sgz5001063]|uniref:RDD family protein n=1 Tax=Paenibacillus sp. sgz5001063 TaxID=3242474 RepID=UPI0036D3A7A7